MLLNEEVRCKNGFQPGHGTRRSTAVNLKFVCPERVTLHQFAGHTRRWNILINDDFENENNLLNEHVRCLLCPDNLQELEEYCSMKRFGAKMVSNQGMDPTEYGG